MKQTKMQDSKSLFNEAFYCLNSNTIDADTKEDYYTQILTDSNFNKGKNRRFIFSAKKEDYESAVNLFEQFLIIKPDCKYAHNYCGIAKGYINDFQGAVENFSKAINIDSKFDIGFFNKGYVQYILKEYEAAIKNISIAITLNKHNGVFYEIRGTSRKELKKYKEAIKDFSNSLELHPNNERVLRLRAFSHLELNNYESAIEDFNKVCEINPTQFEGYFSRGYAYFNLKKYSLAITDLEKATLGDPDSSSINSMLKEAKIKLHIENQSLSEANLPSKKPLILKAISTMNISLLEVLLEDYKTYQDAPKDIFIEKMNVLFEQFKEKKDSKLIPYKGKCNSKNCINMGCDGFSFIGNVSKCSVDLIFEETENNYNDIYNCTKFKISDQKIIKKRRFSFDMKIDEKANFHPSPSKAVLHQNAIAAFDKIIKSKHEILTNEILTRWVKTNQKLYNKIEEETDFIWSPYRSIDNFTGLFSALAFLTSQIEYETAVLTAINNYQELDSSIETNVLKWLLTYEELYDKVKKIKLYVDKEGKLIVPETEGLVKQKFVTHNFKNIVHFATAYQKQYWPMLKKYQVLEEGVAITMNPASEQYHNLFSLKYNLEKSGIKYK